MVRDSLLRQYPLPDKPVDLEDVCSRVRAIGKDTKYPLQAILISPLFAFPFGMPHPKTLSDLFVSAYHMLSRTLKGQRAQALHSVLRKCHLHLSDSSETFISRAKLLSSLMKLAQSDASPDWRALVDWQMVFAFQTPREPVGVEDLYSWLRNEHLRPDLYDGSDYYTVFSRGCVDFWSQHAICASVHALPIDDWLQSPWLWATPGSSNEAGSLVEGQRKTKWTLYYSKTHEQLRRLLLSTEVMENRVFIKSDEIAPKTRLIASSSDSAYLKMSYLNQFIQPFLVMSEVSTLASDSVHFVRIVERLQQIKPTTVNLDTDQSGFDHQASRRMVLIALQATFDFILQHCGSHLADCQLVISLLREQFIHQQVTFDTVRFLWTNGVASGWRWTALLDTMINWAECYCVDYDAVLVGRFGAVMKVVQGDDITALYAGQADARIAYAIWCDHGFDINALKTLFDTPYSEYLRKVYAKGVWAGYPARLLHSFLTPAPGQDVPKGLDALLHRANLWVSLASRACGDVPCELSSDFIHQPASLGGFSLQPLSLGSSSLVPKVQVARVPGFFPFQAMRLTRLRRTVQKAVILTAGQAPRSVFHVVLDRDAGHAPTPFYKDADYVSVIKDRVSAGELSIDLAIELLVSHLDSNGLSVYVQLKNATRKVQYSWLTDTLPRPSIKTLYDSRWVSIWMDACAACVWRDVIRYHHISMGLWNGLVLAYEMAMSATLRFDGVNTM